MPPRGGRVFRFSFFFQSRLGPHAATRMVRDRLQRSWQIHPPRCPKFACPAPGLRLTRLRLAEGEGPRQADLGTSPRKAFGASALSPTEPKLGREGSTDVHKRKKEAAALLPPCSPSTGLHGIAHPIPIPISGRFRHLFCRRQWKNSERPLRALLSQYAAAEASQLGQGRGTAVFFICSSCSYMLPVSC